MSASTVGGPPAPIRALLGHKRALFAFGLGIVAYVALPHTLAPQTRAVAAWDGGAAAMLVAIATMFARARPDDMPRNAEAQAEGEWTAFWVTIAAVVFSFVAVTRALADASHLSSAVVTLRVSLVAATLLLSWLVTQAVFASRYAHEWYERRADGQLAKGLIFPGEDAPDYWDFVYFSVVLGMTFQVSDVNITARPLRRLAAVHGFLGFVFNTVIVALTVNAAAALI